MTYSWDDEHLDVVNPDLSLLMSDCPAELSIQSHGLMLNVRRSVQLPHSREGTALRRTQVPFARDVRVLRRVQSFQDPTVSSSLGSSGGSYPVLTRVRSFFDFSREDAQVLDFKASNILPQSEKVCAGGDVEVEEEDNQRAAEEKVGASEAPAASDVKNDVASKLSDYAEAHMDNGAEKAVDSNGSGLDKPVTGTAGAVKVDVSETIKKIESALEDALNVGSLKIDVRERIKRIQSAFEGFIPWDSAVGRPKGELRDLKPVDKVEVEDPPEGEVVKLKASQSDDGTETERENNTEGMKEGGLDDSKLGDEVQACTLGLDCVHNDSPVELNQEQIIQDMKDSRPDLSYEVGEVQVDTPRETTVGNSRRSQYDCATDEFPAERIIEGMEDGGLCLLNNVREAALSTEVVNPVVSLGGAFNEDETLNMETEETGLTALDSMDEMQAVILDFEAVNPIVVVRDPLSELKDVKMNNDMREGVREECDRATQVQVDSPCNAAASRPSRVQSDALYELKQETRIKDVNEETPEYYDRSVMVESSGYTAVTNVENDTSSELNQILEEIKSRQTSRLKLIANVDKFEGDRHSSPSSWDTSTGKSGNLQSDDKVNLVSETSLTTLTLKGVDNVRPNMLWNVVSEIQRDTQIAASSELKQDRVVKKMKDTGLRIRVGEVQLEAGGESVLSEKDTTDISGLPSPLSQLLDYRHGSAFTFLNVHDNFPHVGDCLLHDEEKVCLLGRKVSLTQPGFPSMETNLKSLLTPGESWCSQEEQTPQSSGGKNSDSRRSKGTINLRRLRLRKSVRPSPLKASPANLPSERELDTLGLHASELSETVDNLRKDDSRSEPYSSTKPARADSLMQSTSSLHLDIDQTPLNVGHKTSHIDRGEVSMKFRPVAEPSLKQHEVHRGSPLHTVNKIPGNSASVIRLNVENHKNLSEKYRPTRFEELVGQTTVVKSLATSISKRKVAPLYLFLGPKGTGKTSAARIFAAGLNCISSESKIRPCGSCGECRAVILDMSPYVKIVDAATIRDSSSMKAVINYSASHVGYKVIIIKGCDLLITEIWTVLLYIMEEPPSNVVLLLISTTANRIPLTAISRCKKLHFYNLSDREIVDRLLTLACQEDLEVEEGVLSIVASRSNGSIHEAEILLDQLSLVDKRVSLASVQELVGLLPDRKLLNLLDYALSADTANTTQTMNEILGSSVEPLLLVSQLGILITNILVENFDEHQGTRNNGYFRPSFANKKIQQRLRQALKILSEAEKHLRVSSDSLTWLAAALLQCSSDRPFPPSIIGSLTHTPITSNNRELGLERSVSTDFGTADIELRPTEISELASEQTRDGRRHLTSKPSEPSSRTVEIPVENSLVLFGRESKEASAPKSQKVGAQIHAVNRLNVQETLKAEDVQMFEERDSIQLWNRVLQVLTSRNLKHLLLTQGRLVSAGVASDGSSAIVEIEFQYASDKHKAERSWRTICSAFQSVLSIPIELRISLLKNVFDEGVIPRNLEGLDDEERSLLIQHTSRLKQETEVACYSTDSQVGPHSKRRRRRAQRDWQPKEILVQELEPQPRSEAGSVPGPMQPTHRRNGSIARPIGEWHANGLESSFSESVEQNSGSTKIGQSSMPIGGKGRRPRLRTMLDAAKSDTDDNQDIQSNAAMQKVTEFRTDRGLPLDAFCFPCNQRMPQFRRQPTRDMDQFESGRERDLRSEQMDGRVSVQGQPFFLRLVPCKSISTVRTSKAQPQ